MDFKELLASGAEKMGIELTGAAIDKMAEFQRLITEANKVMNLTRVSDEPEEAVDRNFLDSLAPVGLGLISAGDSLADIGAGAGFPSIPLAIALGNEVTMVDSLKKRVDFLNAVSRQLGLNARAVHARAEDFAKTNREAFDIATARAVAQLNVLCEYALPVVKVGGRMIAYKGPRDETAQAKLAIKLMGGGLAGVHEAPIPGRDWAHTLVVIDKLRKTPFRFPRKPAEIEKDPLL